MNSTPVAHPVETRTAPNTATVSQEKTISQLVAEVSTHTLTLVPSLSTHPLVSIAAAAYVLGLLYLPRYLLSLLLSPVAVSTLLLLAILLHFGSAAARLDPQTRPPESRHHAHSEKAEQHHLRPSPPYAPVLSFPHKPVVCAEHHYFAELTRRGPLEVIYEEYEGEEVDGSDDGVDSPPGYCRSPGRGRHQALEGLEPLGLRFCTDDSSSECSGVSLSPEWDSPENLCFLWEVEEDGLIEIPLEEDNLIEIDLSACR